jgi:hypothetical protein
MSTFHLGFTARISCSCGITLLDAISVTGVHLYFTLRGLLGVNGPCVSKDWTFGERISYCNQFSEVGAVFSHWLVSVTPLESCAQAFVMAVRSASCWVAADAVRQSLAAESLWTKTGDHNIAEHQHGESDSQPGGLLHAKKFPILRNLS